MPDNSTLYRKRLIILEKYYAPKIEKILRQQIKLFVNDLNQYGKEYALGKLRTQMIDEALMRIIQDIYGRAGKFGGKLTLQELKAEIRAPLRVVKGMGTNPGWLQSVIDYLSKLGFQFLFDMNETTLKYINYVLNKGVTEGWGIGKIVDELESPEMSRMRAQRIARTEIVRAANVGHQEAAKTFPYEVNKKWVAAKDHRTRHAHNQVNQMQVGENDLFKVPVYKGDKLTGYEEMNAPGDPKGSKENTINCRCRITHVPKRDAQGKLIPRSSTSATIIPLRAATVQNDALRAAIAASVKAKV